MHEATHDPATHFGVAPLQLVSVVHCACVGSGWHTPLVHVAPAPHWLGCVHVATHWPFAHDLPLPHSLEYLHVSAAAVHAPPAHTRPPEQSVVVVQGQGPLVPPHAWHLLWTHTPPVHSAFVVHSFGVPGVDDGVAHRPLLQMVPRSQSPSALHIF